MTQDGCTITPENIETAKEDCPPLDIRAELVPGCTYWRAEYGYMAIWPSGRGAVCFGGDSDWGEWEQGYLMLDNPDSDGNPVKYDGNGKLILDN